MNHSPRKCAICGKYHCLAGCVPVEQCKGEGIAANVGLMPEHSKEKKPWTEDDARALAAHGEDD